MLDQMTGRDIENPTAATDPSRGVAMLSDIAGERASQGPGNKIVTAHAKTFFAWQDSFDQRYFARVRSYDHATGEWSPSAVLSEGVDEHSRPTLAIDTRGYLHVVMGGHNTPLQYQRSLRPYDATAWSDIVAFGKNTYPVLLCGPDDTLYLACRHGTHSGMEWFSKARDGDWQSHGNVIDRQPRFSGYTAMHNDLAWGPGQRTLHMTMGYFLGRKPEQGEHPRDPQGTYQAVGYMKSADFGVTWTKADGSPIELPGTSETVDLLEEATSNNPKPGIQHCGVAVDSKDRPYAAYVRHTPTPCNAFLKTFDNGAWRRIEFDDAVDKQWPGWGVLGVKPTFTADDTLCMLLNLVPCEHPAANWNPGVFGRPAFWLRDHETLPRIGWLESNDFGETFTARDVLAYDPDMGQVLSSLERAHGPHPIEAGRKASFIYTLGESRYANEGETIQNKLFWVQP